MFGKIISWLKGEGAPLGKFNSQAVSVAGAQFEVASVPGSQALKALLAYRARGDVVPVVLGDKSERDGALEIMGLNEGSFDEYLKSGQDVSVADWVAQRYGDEPECFQTEDNDGADPRQSDALSVANDPLSGKPKKEVFIALLPVKQPWHVPAYLRPGNWNECPGPEVHVAFFKHWYEKYGAVVSSVTNDVIEFSVERPPATLEEAKALAHEQFAYCPDIVHQGAGSEAALSKALHNSKNWFFWWD